MDHDPYRIHLTASSVEGEAALRASVFSLALLMPRLEMEAYAGALNRKLAELVDPRAAHQLATYFEVGYDTLAMRYLALGLLTPDKLPAFKEALAEQAPEAPAPDPVHDWGNRYVRLALAAHQQKEINLPKLAAKLLEISKKEALALTEGHLVEKPETESDPGE